MSMWFLFMVIFMYMIFQGILIVVLLINIHELKSSQITKEEFENMILGLQKSSS